MRAQRHRSLLPQCWQRQPRLASPRLSSASEAQQLLLLLLDGDRCCGRCCPCYRRPRSVSARSAAQCPPPTQISPAVAARVVRRQPVRRGKWSRVRCGLSRSSFSVTLRRAQSARTGSELVIDVRGRERRAPARRARRIVLMRRSSHPSRPDCRAASGQPISGVSASQTLWSAASVPAASLCHGGASGVAPTCSRKRPTAATSPGAQ